MKKVLRNLLLVSASCLVMVACNKDDDDDSTTGGSSKTKTELLTGDWKMTNMKVDPPWDAFFNWDSIPSCEKDDIFTFEANGNGVADEGATKCDPTDPQSETMSWEWTNTDETEMRLITAGDTSIFKNITISTTTMTAVQEEPALQLKATMTFTKQ